MAAIKLNERQRAVLKFMGQLTKPCPPPTRETVWHCPDDRVYAFQIAELLTSVGMGYQGRGDYSSHSKSAANTLKALKSRGLVTSDSGGVYLQARWWITPAGFEWLEDNEREVAGARDEAD